MRFCRCLPRDSNLELNTFQKCRFHYFSSFEVTYQMLTQMQHMGQNLAGVKTPAKIQNSIIATAYKDFIHLYTLQYAFRFYIEIANEQYRLKHLIYRNNLTFPVVIARQVGHLFFMFFRFDILSSKATKILTFPAIQKSENPVRKIFHVGFVTTRINYSA